MKLFAENRKSLLDRIRAVRDLPRASMILLEGGVGTTRHCTDHEDVFRQESYFQWTFGVTEPDFFGAIDVDSGRSILFAPYLPAEYAVWMGKVQSESYFKEKYEVDEVHFTNVMNQVLTDYFRAKREETGEGGALLLLEGLNTDSGNKSKPASFEGIENLDKAAVNKTILHPVITECRVFKSEYELELMRYTNRVSSEAHKEVMRRIEPGMHEFQLESIFQDHCYRLGGMRHMSYTCICASGINASTLHYGHAGAPNDRKIGENDLCLFDMGGEYYCYASDITCSYPSNGVFNARQRAVYELTLNANRTVNAALKPGVSWVDMHLLSDRCILEGLVKAGILVGDIDEMMKCRLAATFCPHGLGHFIGIDTHDVGGYPAGHLRLKEPGLKSLRTTRKLEKGMVITTEPGCYFIDILLDQALADETKSKFIVKEVLQEYRGMGGARVEDNIYITETGSELLTDVPRTVEEIETFMREQNAYVKKSSA